MSWLKFGDGEAMPPKPREVPQDLTDWDKHKLLVMQSLEMLLEELRSLRADMITMKVTMASAQTRQSIISASVGALIGAIVGAVVVKVIG